MASSPDAAVANAGAQHLAIASLGRADLDAAVDELLAGGPAQRRGVVTSFAENAAYEPRRARIVDVLRRAFNDPDPQIRSDAQRCFWKLRDTRLAPYRGLFQAYADSPCFYTQHEDPNLRRHSLDLIDAMITVGAYGMREQLTTLDR